MSGTFDEATYSALEEGIYQKIQKIDDFQSPDYLKQRLNGFLQNNLKGIMLLQMERGMGKTTFARALDPHSLKKYSFANVSIRSYYINDSYAYKVDNFTSEICDLIRKNDEGNLYLKGKAVHLNVKSQTKKEDLAKLLNYYRDEYEKHFHTTKLLVVIDGLDEIPSIEDSNIMDFIPDPEILNKGVFILLTCRTNKEIEDKPVRLSLQQLHVTDLMMVSNNNINHYSVMKLYIKNVLGISNETRINELLIKAEYRFLYLRMLKELLLSNRGINFNELPLGRDLFNFYLETLKKHYGDKFFNKVISLLSVLATGITPLTVKQISYLLGYHSPSFSLLSYLVDLRGFLKVERGLSGNIISIAHIELKQVVESNYRPVINNLVETWIETLTGQHQEQINVEHEGEVYLHAHLLSYSKNYSHGYDPRLLTVQYVSNLLYAAKELWNKPPSPSNYDYIIFITKQITTLCLYSEWTDENIEFVSSAYFLQGEAFNSISRAYMAVNTYKECLAFLEGKQAELKCLDTMIRLALSCQYANDYTEADFYYTKAYELYEEIFKK
ncbi:hypothetical protein F6Y02_41060 (plasmid) [Bacillus megaterium]|nr:hypothetical protein [Priestia megaterium]